MFTPSMAAKLVEFQEAAAREWAALMGRGEVDEGILSNKTQSAVQFLVSSGQNGGLYDQTNPQKSVYLNNTPVMAASGSLNYQNVVIEERYGLSSQTAMDGFPRVSSTFTLGTKVTTVSAVTYTTTTADVDAVRLTLRFPALYYSNDDGGTDPTSVRFQIYTAGPTGGFTLARDITKRDTSIAAADMDYVIKRVGTGTVWRIQVVRVTADNTSSRLQNDLYVQFATELKNLNLSYPGRAYVGVQMSSENTGSTYPTVSFDYLGRLVSVPNNYNAVTRVYTGVWSGAFAGTKVWTNNPIWCLLDMLTDGSDGLGLSVNDIDVYSFYDAAVYCDELVPALVDGVVTGTEPRYTLNWQNIESRDDEWTAVQNIAATADCVIYTAGNLVRLVQDRPTSSSRLITNSNVIDGKFNYTSSQLTNRTTAAMVWWIDENQNSTSVPAYYEAAEADITRYGLNVTEITGRGITSEGQAMRKAKWNVETALSNRTTVSFKVGFENCDLMPGEVVSIADSHYQGVVLEGRVQGVTGSTVTLDKPVTVTSGHTISVIGGDADSIETRTITSTGTLSTLSYSGAALTCPVGSTFIIQTAISPRMFKVTGVQENIDAETAEWQVSAVFYDPTKFGRVDSTPTGDTPVYAVNAVVPSAPLNLSFRESAVNDGGVITRKLFVSWTRPVTGKIASYILQMRIGQSNWSETNQPGTTYEINSANTGMYEFRVYAKNFEGVLGPAASGSFDLTTAGAEVSVFDPPTTLVEYYDGGTVFSQDDLVFRWTNPSSNGLIDGGTLRDFEVKFLNPSTDAVMRVLYVPMVAPGSTQNATYTYQMNVDDGGPRRNVKVEVRIRDTNNNLTDEISTVFFNPAPGIPPNLNIVTGLGSTTITYDAPGERDYEGVLIWRSTDPAFTPSFDNLIFDGTETYVVDGSLSPATKYYYIVAAYDSFERNYEGTGLNLSSRVGVTVVDNTGQANMARNSDMNGRDTGSVDPLQQYRPIGYDKYAYPDVASTWLNATGVGSNTAFSLRADAAGTGTFGLMFAPWETPDGKGVAGGWVDGVDYTISFYAKKTNGAAFTGMRIEWDNPPEFSGASGISEVLLNPNLTTSFQRYAFHIKWHAGSTVQADGGLFISTQGLPATNDVITIDRLQVERGESYSGWQPRLDEITPGSITETYIADDAITTPKLVAESVIGSKIAANTITGGKLVVGTVTKTELQATGDVNLIDSRTWNAGMTMPPDGWIVGGDTGEDTIVLTQGPDSGLKPTWKATSGDAVGTDNPDGGFVLSPEVTIDPTKMYRYVVWFKSSVLNTDGVLYHGPGYGYETAVELQTLAGSTELNPYFNSMYRPDFTTDRWFCSVGYVYPYSATGLSSQGGVYDGTTMVKVANGTDYRFKSTTERLGLRVLFYNSSATSVTYFAKPRIDLIDGSEASLQEILASGGVSGFNPINTANQNVIIADGTITAPKITVAQLSALSATIGTLRTATTGQRVEIRDNQILVYDASNVVRVKIGDLA